MSNKEKALAALLSSTSIREAAKKCGLSERTINEYLRTDKDFKRQYEESKRNILRDATDRMTAAMLTAAETLTEICGDKAKNDGTRVQAARSILEYGSRLFELVNINERLEALEEKTR